MGEDDFPNAINFKQRCHSGKVGSTLQCKAEDTSWKLSAGLHFEPWKQGACIGKHSPV